VNGLLRFKYTHLELHGDRLASLEAEVVLGYVWRIQLSQLLHFGFGSSVGHTGSSSMR